MIYKQSAISNTNLPKNKISILGFFSDYHFCSAPEDLFGDPTEQSRDDEMQWDAEGGGLPK